MESVSVVFAGPPPVRTYIVSNTLNAYKVIKTSTTSMLGFKSGSVISQNMYQLEAPSTLAALNRLFGIV